MAVRMITEDEAREWLRRACVMAGGASKLAKRSGVSKAFLSQVLNGKKAITGRLAKSLGLQKVNAYELTLVVPSTLQEQYEKQRAAWREQNPIMSTKVQQ